MDTSINQKTEIFGRKIFFLSTTFSLNTNIILRLMEQEYEVYKVDDYRQLKSILSINPQSIVYINVDSHNTPSTWFNFIKYFETDFAKTSFGIFTGKLKGADRERFKNALNLEAGFFTLDKSFGEVLGDVLAKLNSLNAKGVRQFVRLTCAKNKSAEAYFVNGNMMYKMNFVDISSIGVGIVIPLKYAQIARVNAVIQGLTLVLGPKQLKVNAKIHTIKAIQTGILAVLIFTPDTSDSFRNYIRSYICEELQKTMIDTIMQLPYDKTDYSVVLAPESNSEQEKSQKSQSKTLKEESSPEEKAGVKETLPMEELEPPPSDESNQN